MFYACFDIAAEQRHQASLSYFFLHLVYIASVCAQRLLLCMHMILCTNTGLVPRLSGCVQILASFPDLQAVYKYWPHSQTFRLCTNTGLVPRPSGCVQLLASFPDLQTVYKYWPRSQTFRLCTNTGLVPRLSVCVLFHTTYCKFTGMWKGLENQAMQYLWIAPARP